MLRLSSVWSFAVRVWRHWTTKGAAAALGLYVMYTGATGRELVWKTGPAYLDRIADQNAARWILVLLGLALVVLATGPTIAARIGTARAPEPIQTLAPHRVSPADTITPRLELGSDGFVYLSVENVGPTIADARINIFAPKRRERQWIARIDKSGAPASEHGGFADIDHELVLGFPKAVRWSETNLELHGYTTTKWKFFLPRYDGDPIHVRIGADAFEGWRDWIFIISLEGEATTVQSPATGAVSQTASPLELAESLLKRGGVLLKASWSSGKPSALAATGDAVGVNRWLDDAREAMSIHFPSQAYRVAANVPPDASGATVESAINQTMPALQNFKRDASK